MRVPRTAGRAALWARQEASDADDVVDHSRLRLLLATWRALAGWPRTPVIISRLKREKNEIITREALASILGDAKRAESFIDHYSGYRFVLADSEHAAQYMEKGAH